VIRRGRFVPAVLSALMIATVGATGAAAQPLPAVPTSVVADAGAAKAPLGTTTELAPASAPAPAHAAPTSDPGQQPCPTTVTPQATGATAATTSYQSAKSAATPAAAASSTVPGGCAPLQDRKPVVQMIAEATKARVKAGLESVDRHPAATARRAAQKQAATKPKVAHKGATSVVPATAGSYIAGTVTNSTSDPISGVYVEIDTTDDAFYGNTTTDDTGAYSIAVDPGDYLVWFGGPAGVYADGWYSTSGFQYDESDASTVTVDSGTTTVNVTLPAVIHITGTVTHGGLGLAGISVYASDAGFGSSDTTADDGTYSIAVIPGAYKVSFFDVTGTYGSGYYITSGFTYSWNLASLVKVTTADATADVVLPLAFHIKGTVTSSGGAPLENIEVDVNYLSGGNDDYDLTDSGGHYSIVVAPGDYNVWLFDGSGTYATGYYSTAGFTYSLSAAATVAVTSADVTANVMLPLAIHIKGKVTKSGGAALQGIEVFADNTSTYYQDTTDASGNYSIAVPSGTFTLFFRDGSMTYGSGYYSTAGFTYNSSAASTVTVGSADVTGKNLTLPLAIHIKGKVTGGGVGLEGIQAYASGNGASNWVDTDASGNYSIALPPGSYTLYFSNTIFDETTYARGYYSTAGFTYFESGASAVTLAAVDVTGKNVALPLSIFITGTVTNTSADLLSNITVEADSAGYTNYTYTQDGWFGIDVAPGTYTLWFGDETGTYANGYYSTGGFKYNVGDATTVTVGAATVAGKDLVLPDALHIIGKVTNDSDDPLSGIEVDLSPTSSAHAGVVRPAGTTAGGDTTYTESDGIYSFAVAPGDYTLFFSDASGTYGSGYYTDSGFTYDTSLASKVTVTSGDVTAKDLALPDALHIEGKVTAGGHPAAGIEVDSSGPAGDFVYTGADGTYSLVAAPGDYTIHFNDETGTYGSGYYSASGFTYYQSSATAVNVSTLDVTGKDVTLPAAIHIKGKVTKSGGVGLPGIWVYANGTEGNGSYTAADGTYSIAVGSGNFLLHFYDGSGKYGNGWYSTSGFTYFSASATAVNVASADIIGKNVTLPTAVHIKGKVTKSDGVGLGSIWVEADSVNYSNGGYTAADGTYSVSVAPGSYTLWFSDYSATYGTGYYSTAGFTYFSSSASKVAISTADVTGKNVTLPLAVHIKGKVTKSGGGGLDGVEVDASGVGYSGGSYTAADGTYSVPVAPGSYKLEFWGTSGYASGYYSTTGFTYGPPSAASVVTVSTADATGKNVVLPLAVYLSGKVTDTGDNPLSNIQVVASSTDRTFSRGITTGVDGTYTLEVAPNRSYPVWFRDYSGTYGNGYYQTSGFTPDASLATAVPVTDTSVTGINVKLVAAKGLVFPASTYFATSPARVLDTRPTGGVVTNIGLTGKFTAGTVRTFNVATAKYVGGGYDIAVPWWASAVTGNLTIVNSTAAGLMALGPTMTPTGAVTTINFGKGETRANNVTLGLGSLGRLSAVFRSSTAGATTDVIFDVTGYFMPGTVYGASYVPVAPGRVLDSRPTAGPVTNIGLKNKFANQSVRTFSVSGVKALGWATAQVPATATAVTGNLTVTNATSAGFVAVGPTLPAVPSTSTVNVVKGSNIANGVTVALNAGKLQAVWNGAPGSSADVVFDVTGFFVSDSTRLTYHPIVPARLLDSSSGLGLTGPFATNVSRPLVVGGKGGIPAAAAGISGNLTLVNPSGGGFAFISPLPVGLPTSSTVNLNPHQTAANGFDVALNAGNVCLVWAGPAGTSTNMQLDVTGYWK